MQSPPSHETGQRCRSAWLIALLLAAGAAATVPAHAGDEDTEREHLARIAHEIERVQAMVATAAQDAPTGQRVKFRYDWLASDLQMLREGIERHTDTPRQPRPVAPLRGDYRQ
ncbi:MULTISPECIES: RAQPRD family integrative conjugative element protein [unclassified Acidovorax]|uniref:integrative conjugative element protein, RAQPRD family n=1 Tax=unclassified Acidovorax TaxID=2684926 RepID=UPI0023DE68B8|nr:MULTISPECIES: RAQPRD family integrative conjugative element protein [unclassified Acidovorax]GKS92646.1 RAQPRD family integrative conjugative element protein [Acidovorax sp. SUPP2539]